MGDLRQTGRFQYAGKVQLSWMDREGNPCIGQAECIDISEGGMRVRLKVPLEVRAYVSVKLPSINLHGSASVRSCVRERMQFLVGLQFTGGMKLPATLTPAATSVA